MALLSDLLYHRVLVHIALAGDKRLYRAEYRSFVSLAAWPKKIKSVLSQERGAKIRLRIRIDGQYFRAEVLEHPR